MCVETSDQAPGRYSVAPSRLAASTLWGAARSNERERLRDGPARDAQEFEIESQCFRTGDESEERGMPSAVKRGRNCSS
jgi:hypothetical protein